MKNKNLEQVGTESGGNTKTPNSDNKYRKWTFTWNNYHASSIDEIIEFTKNRKGKYGIGEEIGGLAQKKHLQGWLSFKNPIHFNSLKCIDKEIHWEKMKGSIKQNHTYCSKDGKYQTNDPDFEIKKPIKLWQQWQFDIEKLIQEEPDDRKIYWYWENKGATGKTTMARYLSRNYGAIPLEGKKNDILYCAAEHPSNIYIYDMERSLENFVSYASIEKIKNGYFMCSKYESRPIDRNPPHLIIFANFPPDKEKLSLDRWIITEL